MEKTRSISTTHLDCSSIEGSLRADFTVLDSRVSINIRSMNDRLQDERAPIEDFTKAFLDEEENSPKDIIKISTIIESNAYDSVSTVDIQARPRVLIILSILSLFTGEPFTTFQQKRMYSSVISAEANPFEDSQPIFIFNDVDRSSDLKSLIVQLNNPAKNQNNLFYSLADRWRKALYFETESIDTPVFIDESLLAYFHVLELMGDTYKAEIASITKGKVSSFIVDYLENDLKFSGDKLDQKKVEFEKVIYPLLSNTIDVSSKILHCLDKLNIYDDKVRNYISTITHYRNLAAHGRQVYLEKVIFPVPPFFPLIKDYELRIDTIRILTGRVISAYMGLELYRKEWEEEYKSLPTPLSEVKAFLESKSYEKINLHELISNGYNNVFLYDIGIALVNKKIKPLIVLPILQQYEKQISYEEDYVIQLLYICIFLLDHTKDDMKDICRKVILTSYENDWLPHWNMRDLLLYLEYKNVEVIDFKKMIEEKVVR